MSNSNFSGKVQELEDRANRGTAEDVDYILSHLASDVTLSVEEFGILELALSLGEYAPANPEARLNVENQSLIGHLPGDGTVRLRFCPKAARVFNFTVRSNVPTLDGQTGAITAYTPESGVALQPSPRLPNWWTDDPDRAVAEETHGYTALGAKTVNRWRLDFLQDFAERMGRCTDG